MNSEVNELIELLERISNRLDKICNDEINYNNYLSNHLEQMSFETYKQAQDLKVIGEYL